MYLYVLGNNPRTLSNEIRLIPSNVTCSSTEVRDFHLISKDFQHSVFYRHQQVHTTLTQMPQKIRILSTSYLFTTIIIFKLEKILPKK
jgi:hypothetical protein